RPSVDQQQACFEREDTEMENQDVTLVIGGTGKTGRRVVEALKKQELPVRIGARSSRPALDWNDSKTWRPCLEGVRKAYVTYHPDLCVPGAVDTVRDLFGEAVRAGVKKLVFLSGRGETEAMQAEQALQECPAEWTVLRSSFFSQNFSED